MESEWFKRLKEVIESDPRGMRRLSLDAGFGPNYVQQMLKDGKEPRVGSLVKLLAAINVSRIYFVLTGTDITDEDRAFLASVGSLDPVLRSHAEALLLAARDSAAPSSSPPSDGEEGAAK